MAYLNEPQLLSSEGTADRLMSIAAMVTHAGWLVGAFVLASVAGLAMLFAWRALRRSPVLMMSILIGMAALGSAMAYLVAAGGRDGGPEPSVAVAIPAGKPDAALPSVEPEPPTPIAEAPPDKPDVTVLFIQKKAPVLVLRNISKLAARDVRCWFGIWDLDRAIFLDPLPIPAVSFASLAPGEDGGPLAIFARPQVSAVVNDDDRLIGFAAVTCPDCGLTRTFWVYIKWGEGGWISEAPQGKEPTMSLVQRGIGEMRRSVGYFFGAIKDGDKISILNKR